MRTQKFKPVITIKGNTREYVSEVVEETYEVWFFKQWMNYATKKVNPPQKARTNFSDAKSMHNWIAVQVQYDKSFKLISAKHFKTTIRRVTTRTKEEIHDV